jgi:hypothetical protein
MFVLLACIALIFLFGFTIGEPLGNKQRLYGGGTSEKD